ncbi:hypothetical protein BSKO_06933 [Bryopsis sp. KO-2023]|nr:hypothetical protein BSKO_06933 [Bryopsis sp. KO-2023]
MSHVDQSELAKKFGGVPERSRRERKKPEFFKCDREDKPVVAVGKGKGTELKAIGNVAHRMSKLKAEDEVVTFLHRAMFKRPGKGSTRKRAILSFSGFSFPAETEASEFEKVKEKTAQQPVKVLNAVIALFDLPKGLKEKAAKVEAIVCFLNRPAVLSDVDASQQVKKKRKAPQPKRKSSTKRKAEDDAEEEEEAAETKSEPKPQPKKRVRRSRRKAAAADGDDAALEETPQESPESDDPAPKAEENEGGSNPENAEEAKGDADEMDSEEEGENANDLKEDQEGDDVEKEENSDGEAANQETGEVGAKTTVTNEGETKGNGGIVKDKEED